MEMLGIMKRVELFRGLTDDQLMRLAGISQTETYPQGGTICEQGDIGDKMYVVAQGQVEIRVRDSHGSSYSAVYLGEGQVVGEMALLDEGKRSATVVAVHDDTMMFAFPNKDFAQLCRSDTAIGYVMMRNLAQDLSFKLRHLDAN
jgi:CRP-like cAMP-binding protein